MDSETIKESDTEAGCSLFRTNQIGIWNETPKKKTRFRYSKIPLGTLKSSVSGTRGLLNFPEHNLKNCSWREIMYAKKSNHLANKLNCRLVYKPHSSIIVLTTELLQSAAGRGLNAPQPAWLNLWWDSNRVWHTAASLILFLSLQNLCFHFKHKSPVGTTHWK